MKPSGGVAQREVEAFVAKPDQPGPRLEASGWDGCRVTEMIDAAYRSSMLQAEVALESAVVHVPTDTSLGIAREPWG